MCTEGKMPDAQREGKVTCRCPHCEARLSAPAERLGKKARCPKCREVFVLEAERMEGRDIAVADAAPSKKPVQSVGHASSQAAQQTETAPVCPSCGEELEPGMQHCIFCGASVAAEQGPPPPPPPRASAPAEARTEEPAAAAQEVPPLSFAGRELDYSFTMPTEGWQRHNRRVERQTDADIFVYHDDIGAIKCVVSEWNLDFEDLYEALEEAYASEVSDFELMDKAETTVAGERAGRIEYQGIDEDGDRMKFISHVFVRDGKCLQVIGMALPLCYPRLKREVEAAIASFSFDPERAERIRQAEGRSGGGGLFATRGPSALPDDVSEVLRAGTTWGLGGAGIGLLLALWIVAGGSAGGGPEALAIFVFLPFMCGVGGASLRWGSIAADTGGGSEVVNTLIGIAMIPMRMMGFVFSMFLGDVSGFFALMEAFYRFVFGLLSRLAAGLPYLLYVLISKKVNVGALGYICLVALGGGGALLALSRTGYGTNNCFRAHGGKFHFRSQLRTPPRRGYHFWRPF